MRLIDFSRIYTKICSFLLITLITSSASAFYTVMESGDLLRREQKEAAGELQFITSGDDGLNFIGRFDMGFDEDTNLRFAAGAGTTDFFVAGYLKWVPFPDFDRQPAVGCTFGAQYGHLNSDNDLALRIIPFVAKKFDLDRGQFSPYAALPFAFSNYGDDTITPFQFVIGSRYRHPDFDSFDFNLEFGFDINDAFTYISLGAVFPAFE